MANTETSGFTRMIAETQRRRPRQLRGVDPPRRAVPPPPPAAALAPRVRPAARQGDLGHQRWFDEFDSPAVVNIDIEVGDLTPVDQAPAGAAQADPWESAETRPYDPSSMPALPRRAVGKRRPWAAIAITLGVLLWGAVAVKMLLSRSDQAQAPARVTLAAPALSEAAPAPAPVVPVVAAAAVAPVPAPPVITPVPATLELPKLSADTRVELDGLTLGSGPMRIDQLDSGPHRLLLERPGRPARRFEVDLAPGLTRLTASADPDPPAKQAHARKHKRRRR